MDWKTIVGTVAPTIATALGSPLAGMATSTVLKALGIDSEKKIEEAIKDPEALLKLKLAENEFVVKMKELDIRVEELSVRDRDSARQREIAVKDKTPARLAYIMVGGFLTISFIQIIGISFFPAFATAIPSEGWLLIGNISGYLANEAKQAAAYYFGTTASSSQKNDIIAGFKNG